MWRNQNFLGKLLILARPRETHFTHASFFKLTKRQFLLLTHCWFYRSITQITYDVTSKLSVNIVYFFCKFCFIAQLSPCGTRLVLSYIRSFQRSFENCAPFLKILSSQILPKTFSKEVLKICILSLVKKSPKDLPKKFWKFGPSIWTLHTHAAQLSNAQNHVTWH